METAMSLILFFGLIILGAMVVKLRGQMNSLSIELRDQQRRLDALEGVDGETEAQAPAVPAARTIEKEQDLIAEGPGYRVPKVRPQAAAMASEAVAEAESDTALQADTEEAARAAQVDLLDEPQPAAPPARDIETALGSRWAVWVGGVALAFGGLFLVRYSIEAGLLGPAARLTIAAVFGLLLLAAGEIVRRTGLKVPLQGMDNAYVPAILTAAGGFTLFAATYTAHGVYGFIGSGPAFVLLGAVALLILFLSLIHGLALAALGLLGALVAPALVASAAPNVWALFIYLAIVLVAALAVARIRSAHLLATTAYFGVGVWALLYLWNGPVDISVVVFISVVLAGSLALLWDHTTAYALSRAWGGRLPYWVVAFFMAVIVLWQSRIGGSDGLFTAVAIVALMVLAAAWKDNLIPLLSGAGVAAILMIAPLAYAVELVEGYGANGFVQLVEAEQLAGGLLILLFLTAGVWKALQTAAIYPTRAMAWIGWAGAVALAILSGLWWRYGNPEVDLRTFLWSTAVAVVLVYAAEHLARREEPAMAGGRAVSAALIGAGLLAVLALRTGLGPVWSTMAIGAAAVVPALATRFRTYPVLGWLSVGAFAVTAFRIGLDPTIVGWEQLLSARPFFNILLPAYGIPAIGFAFSAWQLARTTDGRPRPVMEVAAVLFAMLTIAMLVRHAMNGGDVNSGELWLAEQSIYTLLSLGMGGALIAIGQRAPSPVMTYGSLVLGCIGAAAIVLLHVFVLNPLVTDEPTGQIPVFNLLLLGYALPALACAALAIYARRKRPAWYSIMLGLLASALAFLYVTLSLRRLFQGEFIGWWLGVLQLENYAYSALWLAFGVVLLIAGMRFRFYALRLASAALIALTVIKVFVIDMSNLEGILRALSFIGLGVILIGIGLAYQRLLRRGESLAGGLTRPAPAPDGPPQLP